jgi:hypothetical protein
MSLKPCRECGREVSTEAVLCPQCGAPRPTNLAWKGTGVEWKSQARVLGVPLIHVAFGRDQYGKIRVAKGVIAVGQFAIGLITVAQFGIGILFGFGQFIFGLVALAQFAGALFLGVGQIATGALAVGQFVAGWYGLCQVGWAKYLWSPAWVDAEALAMFSTLKLRILNLLGL